MNRRQLLTALGLTSGAALIGPRARGASAASPRRLIVASTAHGTVHDRWKMRPPDAGPDSAPWVADLAQVPARDWPGPLAPLHPHRRRLNVIDGVSMASAELDISGYRHEKGWLHAWTGAWVSFTGSALMATAPSLDQRVASQIARPDRIRSLELGVGDARPISHLGVDAQLPQEFDPGRVFARLFGLSDADDPLLQASGSVLDFARTEHRAIRGRLRPADRERLDVHFDLVRQLEQRVQGLAGAACDVPDLASLSANLEGYDMLFDALVELIGAAFACDLTRVVSLSLGDLPSRDIGWGDYLSGDVHNDFAHRIYEDEDAAQAMADYQRHHSAQLARLVAALEQIPEGDGSVMDHTLIVVGSELADGWHSYHKYHMATLGGGWAFGGGQYRHFPWDSTDIEVFSAAPAPAAACPTTTSS